MSNISAYDASVERLKNAWRQDDGVCHCSAADGVCRCGADRKGGPLADGDRLTVSMGVMDSVQTAIADHNAMPAQSRANEILGRERLAQMGRDNERVQGLADGYTDLREQREQEARDENPAHAAYVADLNIAWMNPPNAAGGVS